MRYGRRIKCSRHLIQVRTLVAPDEEQSRHGSKNEGEEEHGDDLWWTSWVWAESMFDLGEFTVAKRRFRGCCLFGRIGFDGEVEDVCEQRSGCAERGDYKGGFEGDGGVEELGR